VIERTESTVEPAIMIEDRARAIDIERRSIFLRDAFEIHIFAVEFLLVIPK
jgi:hypothetical protein